MVSTQALDTGPGQLIGEGGSHGWSRARPRVPGSGYPICPCLGGPPCGCPAVLDRASSLTLESSLFGKGLLTDGGCTVLGVVLWVDGGMGWALGRERGRGRLGPGGHCTHNTASSLPPSFQFLVIAELADPHPPGARKVECPPTPSTARLGLRDGLWKGVLLMSREKRHRPLFLAQAVSSGAEMGLGAQIPPLT